MRDRGSPSFPHAPQPLTVAVAVALFTPIDGALAVLLVPRTPAVTPARRAAHAPAPARERWTLPSTGLGADETLDEAAARTARELLGASPSHLGQAAALGGGVHAAEGAQICVVYFALAPDAADTARHGAVWTRIGALDGLAPGARAGVDAGLAALRAQVDRHPIAFRLLPPTFTLSELQGVYELLLGRRLHKASFRRSLHASALVEATDAWRSEGRGRPAQLFRYAPPRRRRQGRGVRLDLLSS